jgi:hypothetical protein
MFHVKQLSLVTYFLLKIGTFPKEGMILKGFKGLGVQGFDRITKKFQKKKNTV